MGVQYIIDIADASSGRRDLKTFKKHHKKWTQLTCKVKALAMQLRKTSAIPMSLGVMASEDDLARMPKSFGGNCTIPRRPAKV